MDVLSAEEVRYIISRALTGPGRHPPGNTRKECRSTSLHCHSCLTELPCAYKTWKTAGSSGYKHRCTVGKLNLFLSPFFSGIYSRRLDEIGRKGPGHPRNSIAEKKKKKGKLPPTSTEATHFYLSHGRENLEATMTGTLDVDITCSGPMAGRREMSPRPRPNSGRGHATGRNEKGKLKRDKRRPQNRFALWYCSSTFSVLVLYFELIAPPVPPGLVGCTLWSIDSMVSKLFLVWEPLLVLKRRKESKKQKSVTK